MTFAPATLQQLASFWIDHGGVNLGIVGDAAHMAKGYSYHLGKDNLAPGAYSAVTARDRAGLTNAASAMDLGRLGGSLANLRTFSSWLVGWARTNAAGTSDIREIIFTPDGKTVLRWDRERGYTSFPKVGEADDSHLTHTHVSWYRDAEKRDHTTAFRPYFEEADMISFAVPKVPQIGDIAKGVTLYRSDSLDPGDPGRIIVDPARSMPYLGQANKAGVRIVAYINALGEHSGTAYFLPSAGITNIRSAPAADAEALKARIETAVIAAIEATK